MNSDKKNNHELSGHRVENELSTSAPDNTLSESGSNPRLSELDLRAVWENSIDGMRLTTDEGIIIAVNPAFCRMVMMPREELEGQFFGIIYVRNYTEDKKKDWIFRLKTRQVKPFFERELPLWNGMKKWFALSNSYINENQNKTLILTLFRDITQRKLAEAELAKHKTLSETANYGVLIIDTNYRLIYVNKYIAEIHGFDRQTLTNQTIFRFHNRQQRTAIIALLKETTEKGSVSAREIEHHHRSGYSFPMLMNSVLILNEDQTPSFIGLTAIDISEKRHFEQELFQAKKLESIGLLAGGIAHDLNNILSAITGNIALAGLSSALSPKTLSYLRNAESEIARAADLAKQLLTFSKGGEPLLESVDIKANLKEWVESTLEESERSVHFELPDTLWPVKIDSGQIRQVVRQIILNADQAMDKTGNIVIQTQNYREKMLSRKQTSYFVKIKFQDQGPGIPTELIDKIFDPYFTTRKNHLGLGLSIAYSIIKKHKGKIEIQSTPGQGTTVALYLPAIPYYQRRVTESQTHLPPKGSGTVLLMDDEVAIREVCTEILEQSGYHVTAVTDGKQAIECYRLNTYDIVILDLIVPGGMGGQQTIQELLKIDPRIKAIVISGYSNEPVLSNYQRYGFKAALAKPFQLTELVKIVSRFINFET